LRKQTLNSRNTVMTATTSNVRALKMRVIPSPTDAVMTVTSPIALAQALTAPSPKVTSARPSEFVTKPQTAQPSRFTERLRGLVQVVIPPLVVLMLLLVFWEIAASGAKSALPSPSRIWKEAHDLILDPFFVHGTQDIGLGWRVLTSLQRVVVGFSLAAFVGILLGALVGQSEWAMRGLDPIFQVLRTVPPLAWLPISLAAFRDSAPSAIFVIFITAIWPVIINTAVGIRNIPQDYRNVSAVLRLSHTEFMFKIMLPAAAPYIFTGLRIGIGLAWLAIVAAEMLTGGVGIGFFIWDAWNSSKLSDIVVALVYIGVIGFVLDRLVAALGNFVSRGTAST
jgi:nitrate/nitrite transport system permease protein